MTIDRTYPIFTVRWLAVHGLIDYMSKYRLGLFYYLKI